MQCGSRIQIIRFSGVVKARALTRSIPTLRRYQRRTYMHGHPTVRPTVLRLTLVADTGRICPIWHHTTKCYPHYILIVFLVVSYPSTHVRSQVYSTTILILSSSETEREIRRKYIYIYASTYVPSRDSEQSARDSSVVVVCLRSSCSTTAWDIYRTRHQ